MMQLTHGWAAGWDRVEMGQGRRVMPGVEWSTLNPSVVSWRHLVEPLRGGPTR